ncbi:MAG: calcineurin-like phosphoesterase C-terminal domain-containing protein [Planctomycetes bacterium]|nr:calcineurin-like phosphoesterase C-terminal domain-containing protein [Planctomycetota bacterium]
MRLLLPLLALLTGWTAGDHHGDPAAAQGTVFHDRDGDGRKDAGEPGLPGVRVSNGREVVETGADGRWCLPVDGPTELFVLKPRGWMVPLAENGTPQHYYLHRPEGSPRSRFPGVAPTGPLPGSIDFPLAPQEEPEVFRALFFGDTQPRDRAEIEFMDQDVVDECLGFDGEFGVVLGDLVFDGLGLFGPLTESLSRIGVPWWMVLGNHDQNTDAASDQWANETFNRNFGPASYAFDWGPAHFLVLDNVEWFREEEGGRSVGKYRGRLSERALEFARNDLAGVPDEAMVVVLMHIPLTGVSNRARLFRLLEPFPRAVSVAAHSHTMRVEDLAEQHGWRGAAPHTHVVNVTACGSWWSGEPDARGVPHATMSDGAPNGWTEWTFSADDWSFVFRAAGEPPDKQMSIHAGAAAAGGRLELTVNVWGGGPRTRVEARWLDPEPAGADWTALARTAAADPAYAAMREAERAGRGSRWREMPEPSRSAHLWRGGLELPAESSGTASFQIRVTDRWDREWLETRSVAVLPPPGAEPLVPPAALGPGQDG